MAAHPDGNGDKAALARQPAQWRSGDILPASDIVRALIEDAAQIVAHSRALQRPLDKGFEGTPSVCF